MTPEQTIILILASTLAAVFIVSEIAFALAMHGMKLHSKSVSELCGCIDKLCDAIAEEQETRSEPQSREGEGGGDLPRSDATADRQFDQELNRSAPKQARASQ